MSCNDPATTYLTNAFETDVDWIFVGIIIYTTFPNNDRPYKIASYLYNVTFFDD